MKKAILILLIFFTSISSSFQAQSLELNQQSQQFVQINSIDQFNGGKWMFGGSTNSPEGDDWYLVYLDSSAIKIPNNNSNEFKNIEQLIASNPSQGHLLIKDDKTYVAKYSINSNTISVFNKFIFNDDEEILKIEPITGGKILALGRKTVNSEERAFLKILNGSFQVDFADYSTLGYFSDYIRVDDSTFYITGSSNGNGGRAYNQYYEYQGDVLENIESDRVFKLGQFQNEGYF